MAIERRIICTAGIYAVLFASCIQVHEQAGAPVAPNAGEHLPTAHAPDSIGILPPGSGAPGSWKSAPAMGSDNMPVPVFPGEQWQKKTPEEVGVDAGMLQQALGSFESQHEGALLALRTVQIQFSVVN